MMKLIIDVLNTPFPRLGISFIVSGTVACPYLNGFSNNLGWLVMGACIFVLVVISVISDFELTEKHRIHIIIGMTIFITYVVFLFLMWGR